MLRTKESNYKQSVKDSDDSVRQNEHENNYRQATHKRTKFVQVCRVTLYNALWDADKSSLLNQNRTVFGGFCVIKNFANRLRGIVEMLSKYFFTALEKITAHAQYISATLYLFDSNRNEDGQSELKPLCR